jgi:ribosomal protein L15E
MIRREASSPFVPTRGENPDTVRVHEPTTLKKALEGGAKSPKRSTALHQKIDSAAPIVKMPNGGANMGETPPWRKR